MSFFKKLSSTEWEKSYFGGFKQVLWDYPEIKVPYQIDINSCKEFNEELQFYTREKLHKLLLLKLKEFDLFKAFLKDATLVQIKKGWKEEVYLKVNPESLSECIKNVIKRDSELGNMFEHYLKLLKKTEFLFPMPPEPEEEEKSEGEGEGEEEDGEKTLSEKPTSAHIESAMDMLEEVEERKKYAYAGEAVSGDLKKHSKFKAMKKTAKPIQYTRKETLRANQLVNLLDISFDPQEDRINSLKTGKLDTSKICEIPAGNLNVYYKVEENQTTKPFSICILGDESGSMGGLVSREDFHDSDAKYDALIDSGDYGSAMSQHSLMKILYKAFSQIVPQDKIYMYGHTGNSNPEIHVYHDKYNQMFEETFNSQYQVSFAQNYDGPVIECVYEKVRSMTDDNIIFISISDGEPSGYKYGGPQAIADLKRVIEMCKRDGFVTVGIGIQFGMIKEIYNYNTIVTDLSKMPEKVSLLINQVVKAEFQ